MRQPPTARRAAIWLSAALASGACIAEDRVFDPFPVSIETRSGAVFAAISGADGTVRDATIDTLSPITIIDSSVDEALDPSRLATDLTLHTAAGTPRFTFERAEVFDLHPCDTGGPFAPCAVGLDGDISEMRGIVGTNILTQQAVRFDFGASQLEFFPTAAGNDKDHVELCEATFNGPFAGGGTLVVANGEVEYSASRPAVGACLNAPGFAVDENFTEVGADVLLVISTGIGPTVLSESAYERFAVETSATALSDLPDAVLHLPSGPVGAKRGELGHVTLIGEVGSDSQERGPCRELWANWLLTYNACNDSGFPDDEECPCPDNANFCRVGASMLLDGPIEVAVLPDEHPVLQSLRVELRPEFAEVDGILGAAALAATRIDFDYPNARMIGRCIDDALCKARPEISRGVDVTVNRSCDGPNTPAFIEEEQNR